jgi:hypothetical protein
MRIVWFLAQFIAFGTLLGLLNGCGVKKEAQEDCGFVQNVYGERISWKTQNPIPLLVDESFPQAYMVSLQNAMKAWEVALGRPVFYIAQTAYPGKSPAQDGVNVIYWLRNWESNRPHEQARTSIFWVGDQIKEADIRINAKNFSFFTGASSAQQGIHLDSLLIHELGHVFGLKHKDDSGSVMATYLASSTQRTKIASVDLNHLKCEYN